MDAIASPPCQSPGSPSKAVYADPGPPGPAPGVPVQPVAAALKGKSLVYLAPDDVLYKLPSMRC